MVSPSRPSGRTRMRAGVGRLSIPVFFMSPAHGAVRPPARFTDLSLPAIPTSLRGLPRGPIFMSAACPRLDAACPRPGTFGQFHPPTGTVRVRVGRMLRKAGRTRSGLLGASELGGGKVGHEHEEPG